MINIFYNTNYIKSKKVLLTRHLKHSILINLIIDCCYFLNIPIMESFIQSGPHKRMNNLIKTFKNDLDISFNKLIYSNSYVVQYDQFGKNIVEKIINSKLENKKIIIGPLYSISQDYEINFLTKKYPYIQKLVASEIAYINSQEMDNSYNNLSTVICPSGVISKNEVELNLQIDNRKDKCLIYFKKRPKEELHKLLNFLKKNNQEYEIFEYGNYNNKKLKEASKNYSFGIIMSRPETQGFGIQEIMSCNLPLLVWDQTINYYEHFKLSGTTVSVWNDECGQIVYSFKELEKNFFNFKKNIKKYNPAKLILSQLTYESFNTNLRSLFSNKDFVKN